MIYLETLFVREMTPLDKLLALLAEAAKNNFYGTIEVEFQGGRLFRAVVKESVKF